MSRLVVFLAFMIICAVGLVLPYFETVAPIWIVGAFALLLVSIPFLYAMISHQFDLFEPIYLFVLYLGVTTILRGFYLLWNPSPLLVGVVDQGSDQLSQSLIPVFLMCMLGFVALYIGYYSGVGKAIALKLPRISSERWPDEAVNQTVLVGLFVGVIGMLAYVVSLGGPAALLLDQSYFAVEGTVGKYYLIPPLYILPTVAYILYLHGINKSHRAGLRIALVIILGLVIGFFVFRSSKGWLLRPILYLLIFRHYLVKRVKLSYFAIGIVIFIVFAGIFLQSYRSGEFGLFDLQTLTERVFSDPSALMEQLLGRFYGADAILAIYTLTPTVHDFAWGGTLADILIFYIPRAFWPGKPLGYGLAFGTLYFPYSELAGRAFMTPNLIGELYMNFTLVGVLVGMFIVGVLLRTTYVFFIQLNKNRGSLLFYGAVLLNLLFFVEGPIASHVSLALGEVLPILLVYLFLRASSQERGSAREFRNSLQ